MSKKFLSGINVTGTATLNTVADAGSNTDKFLVLDSSNNVSYRTAAELYADLGIGSTAAAYTSTLKHEVKASQTISKGQAVYVSSADGTNMVVSKASNVSEQLSSKTMGLLETSLTTNGKGKVVTEGLLAGLNTSSANAGDPVWLGVDGALIYGLANKPYAPAHLVFIGIVTRAHANQGEIFVKVQNGFELKEIHDVDLITTTPINGHILGYNGTLWVNKTIAGWLGYTPVTSARTLTINGTTYDLSADRSWTISANQNARTEYEFTTNGSTATYTVTYTVGQVDVFYNGSKLSSAEFTATNGTSVTLAFIPPTGQMVEIVAWETGGGVANGRTLTINGVAFDLSANRSWTIDNASLGAQPQLNGTGFVKVSGTTVSYDNSTYALDSAVVKLAGTQTITGTKTFSATSTTIYKLRLDNTVDSAIIAFKQYADGSIGESGNTSLSAIGANQFNINWGGTKTATFDSTSLTGQKIYTLPNSDGTLALTSNIPTNNNTLTNGAGYITSSALSSYLPLTGGTLTGALSGTSATFSSSLIVGSTAILYGNVAIKSNSATSYFGLNVIANSNNNFIALNHTGTLGIIETEFSTGGSHTPIAFVTSGAERMRITTSGNVGIGTSSPISSLMVSKTLASNQTYLTLDNKTNSKYNWGIDWAVLDSTNVPVAAIRAIYPVDNDISLGFYTYNGSGNVTERMRITSGGNVGIGNTNPSVSLHVNGTIWATRIGGTNATPPIQVRGGGGGPRIQTYGLDADSNAWMGLGTDMAGNPYEHSLYFSNAGGGIGRQTIGSYNGTTYTVKMTILDNGSIGAPTGTNIYNPSDVRLKQNIVTLTDGLNKIMTLNPVKFNWVEEFVSDEQGKDMLGFIAQEVQNIIPEAVEGFSDGSSITVGESIIENPLRVNEKFIIPVLVKAVQELKAENDELRAILNRNNII